MYLSMSIHGVKTTEQQLRNFHNHENAKFHEKFTLRSILYKRVIISVSNSVVSFMFQNYNIRSPETFDNIYIWEPYFI
jgi:uncharacterized protein VirK/YbjX